MVFFVVQPSAGASFQSDRVSMAKDLLQNQTVSTSSMLIIESKRCFPQQPRHCSDQIYCDVEG